MGTQPNKYTKLVMLANHKQICASYSFGFFFCLLFHFYIFIFQSDIWTICQIHISLLLSVCKSASVVALRFSIKTDLDFPRSTANIHCGVSHTDNLFLLGNESMWETYFQKILGEQKRWSVSSSSVHSEMYIQKITSPCSSTQSLLQVLLMVLEIHSRSETWIE